MSEVTKTAFEFARHTTQQFIVLATGIIALTITFSKDFLGGAPAGARLFALLAWVAFVLSVSFGLLTLMALTGSLAPIHPSTADAEAKQVSGAELSIRGSNVVIPSALQIITFLGGLILTVVYGFKAT